MDQDRQDPPSLENAASLGEALRSARLTSGLSMAQLSTTTRVHPRYLTALEQGEFAVLPSRIFSIGYVRAYAAALGLDELTAVERFKQEFPEKAVGLQAPTGTSVLQMRRSSSKILAVVAGLFLVVVGWNVYQRITRIEPPHPSDLASVPKDWSREADLAARTNFTLGTADDAPPDQTTPALYITPGLEEALTGLPAGDSQALNLPSAPVQKAFNPRGAIYGAPATTAKVILQARRPASLVIRQGDGRIHFARQLAAGEAWRAPLDLSATIDVSAPDAFDVYMNGEHNGSLSGTLTSLGSLNNQAQSQARQSEARIAAAAENQARARTVEAARQAQQALSAPVAYPLPSPAATAPAPSVTTTPSLAQTPPQAPIP